MTSKRLVAVAVVATSFCAGVGSFKLMSDVAHAEAENPYIELYELRVSQAESNLVRRQALSELADSKYARAQRLLSSNAISREEYETLYSDSAAARADVNLATKKIEEAKAYLKIIEGLVARGVSIPLCTYEME